MALIKCTECGKEFSDKAAACPACGCPTDYVKQTINTADASANKDANSKSAEEKMRAEVEKVRAATDEAKKLFESRAKETQKKAERTIDLFGSDAVSRVVEIRTDARRACDDLYATLQTLIKNLDDVCRPLLADDPHPTAIKEVADMVVRLNEESEIHNGFGASLNGSDLGNVAEIQYVPSMDCKMIQMFWTSQYSSTPYAVELEKKRREEEAERQKQYKSEEAKAERKRAEEEERRQAEKRADAAEKKAENALRKITDSFEASLNGTIAAKQKIIDKATADKEKAEKELSSLKTFDFKNKIRVRKEIEEADGKIASAKEDIEKAKAEHQEKLDAIGLGSPKTKAVVLALLSHDLYSLIDVENSSDYSKTSAVVRRKIIFMAAETPDRAISDFVNGIPELKNEYRKMFSYLEELTQKGILSKRNYGGKNLYSIKKSFLENERNKSKTKEGIKDEIYLLLAEGGLLTVKEIKDGIPSLSAADINTTMSFIKEMEEEGLVEREEIKRKGYWKLA